MRRPYNQTPSSPSASPALEPTPPPRPTQHRQHDGPHGRGARASRPIQRRVTRRSPRHLMRRPQAWLSCGALHHLPRHRRLVPTTCLPHLLRPPPPGPHLSSRRPCPWLLPHCFRHTASAQPSARAAADRWRAYLCRRAGNKGRELLGGGDGRCVGDRCKCQDRILATERLNQ